MVGPERLELSHIAALDPKSSASTNFATGPLLYLNCHFVWVVTLLVDTSTVPLTK